MPEGKCALLAAIFLALAVPARAADDCHLARVVSVEMGLDQLGRVTVPMSAGGQNLAMLVDTGGVMSGISATLARSLGLKPLPIGVRIRQFGGLTIDTLVSTNAIQFGRFKSGWLDLMVMPDRSLAIGTNGLLGADVMQQYDADFDFANGTFSLFSPEHCEGRVVYWTTQPPATIAMSVNENGHIKIPIVLDGKEMKITVDTGATYSTIGLELAERLFGIDPKSPLLKLVGEGGGHGRNYRYPFKTLTFGDGEHGSVTVSNPDIILVPSADSQVGDEYSALIGIGILRQLHLYVAYGEAKLYVTPATAH